MTKLVRKAIALAVDIKRNPAKYRKAAIVPTAVVIYLLTTYLGADSTITLEVVSAATAAGVYGIPNASDPKPVVADFPTHPDAVPLVAAPPEVPPAA